MSQFTLEPEEDQMLLNAIRAHAMHYEAMHGSPENALLALADKLVSQMPVPEPEDLDEPTEEEIEAHFASMEVQPEDKAAIAAFLDDVPHEQYTHEDDIVEDGHE
jgi:hypothetical protein